MENVNNLETLNAAWKAALAALQANPSMELRIAADAAGDAWARAKVEFDEAERFARNSAGRSRVDGFQRGRAY